MKIIDGKITQATRAELLEYWATREYDDVYSFPDFLKQMQDCGCEIVPEIDAAHRFYAFCPHNQPGGCTYEGDRPESCAQCKAQKGGADGRE